MAIEEACLMCTGNEFHNCEYIILNIGKYIVPCFCVVLWYVIWQFLSSVINYSLITVTKFVALFTE